MLLRTVAISELVVPKSMPTASLCWCGAVDMPGSEICNKAMMNVGGWLAIAQAQNEGIVLPGYSVIRVLFV